METERVEGERKGGLWAGQGREGRGWKVVGGMLESWEERGRQGRGRPGQEGREEQAEGEEREADEEKERGAWWMNDCWLELVKHMDAYTLKGLSHAEQRNHCAYRSHRNPV